MRAGNMNANYDRMFYFADLNTPGKCFVILTETVNKSDQLMSHAKKMVSVGDIFVVVEPDQVVRALQGDVPLINTNKPLYPVTNSNFAVVVPLMVPQAGKQHYFHLKNVLIQLTKVEAAKASCKGILCDRQHPLMQAGSCGCLYFNRLGSIVLEMTVIFPYTDNNGFQSQCTVPHFCSWRTTQLFLNPLAMTADESQYTSDTREIRGVVASINNIINADQGWTIVGWYKKGEVIDASADPNSAGNEITSDNQPIHISYLYPTNTTAMIPAADKYPRTNRVT
jgi:hypothetical protein